MSAGSSASYPSASSLRSQDPQELAAVLSTTVDIAMILTPEGVISDDVIANSNVPRELVRGWVGKSLSDTVTVESRAKVDQLISAANNGEATRWRQVNHHVQAGTDFPVSYNALRAGPHGHIIALGRDMSALAATQRRLLMAEQAIEQEYQRLRNSETRFRVLLQSVGDAILIIDAKTGRVSESNAAASTLLDRAQKRLSGADIESIFSGADLSSLKASLDALRNTGRADDVVIRDLGQGQQAVMSASQFRLENTIYFMLRFVPYAVGGTGVVVPREQSKVVKLISAMPEGFVVTDPALKVLTANAAFLELAQIASEEQVRGLSLEKWLGRPAVDLNVIASQLNETGQVRNFMTIMRGQFNAVEDVAVSAVAVKEGDMPCFGFTLHRPSRTSAAANDNSGQALLRTTDEFTKLVGKMPLKELVRESTDIIERLCIEAALQMNGDNRANAAEMLGLSRQSLYMKLHRYGIEVGE